MNAEATGHRRRVAFVHSFYGSASPSGENSVVLSEVQALSRAGYEVQLFEARTDDLQRSPVDAIRSGVRVATGRGRSPLPMIREFRPDLVHVHNLFPNFGRAWVREVEAPLVATLHNYRPMCANGLLFREGEVCTACPDGNRLAGVRYRCYRGSALASVPLALANRKGPASDPLLARADRIVCLSEPMAELYERFGVSRSKLVVWPNFLRQDLDPGPPNGGVPREGWLYVGRVSEEKGIVELAERWPGGHTLRIAGSGPWWERLVSAAAGHPRIELVGLVDRTTVIGLMRRSIGMVFPSRWLEACPLVYAEAMASGLPVLAWEPNAVARFVGSDGTGMAARWDADLAGVLDEAEASFPALTARCRAVFEAGLSERAHVERATALYDALDASSRVPS